MLEDRDARQMGTFQKEYIAAEKNNQKNKSKQVNGGREYSKSNNRKTNVINIQTHNRRKTINDIKNQDHNQTI